MKHFYHFVLVSLFAFIITACQNGADFEIGSPSWQQWVETTVRTSDDHGHGPDIGSSEWCDTVNNRLFEGQSDYQPCSGQWNITVDRKLRVQ